MASDPRDYKLDLSSTAQPTDGTAGAPDQSGASDVRALTGRPFLSVHFACCGVYQRIYRDADGQHYAGRCPRCGKPVRFVVGEGGTTTRSFTVT